MYAGRDTANQVGKIAPKIITQATGEINKITQERIDQIIRSRGAEVEHIAPKIIRGAIEEVNVSTISFASIKIKQLRIFPFVVNFHHLTHLLINFKIEVNFEHLFVKFLDPFF